MRRKDRREWGGGGGGGGERERERERKLLTLISSFFLSASLSECSFVIFANLDPYLLEVVEAYINANTSD